MSNILSLEVLQALLNSANASRDNYGTTEFKVTYLNKQIIDLCETAIEYYRRWQDAESEVINRCFTLRRIKNTNPIKATRCLK